MTVDTKAIRSSINGEWTGDTETEKRLVRLLDAVLFELEASNERVATQLAANTAIVQACVNRMVELHAEIGELRQECQQLASAAASAMRSAEHAEREARAVEELLSEELRERRRNRDTPVEPHKTWSSKPPGATDA